MDGWQPFLLVVRGNENFHKLCSRASEKSSFSSTFFYICASHALESVYHFLRSEFFVGELSTTGRLRLRTMQSRC